MAVGREGDNDALYAFKSRGFGGEIGLVAGQVTSSPKERLRTALVVVVYLVTAQAVREKIGTCSASALTSFSLGSPL